jgi:hypothetical protein
MAMHGDAVGFMGCQRVCCILQLRPGIGLRQSAGNGVGLETTEGEYVEPPMGFSWFRKMSGSCLLGERRTVNYVDTP